MQLTSGTSPLVVAADIYNSPEAVAIRAHAGGNAITLTAAYQAALQAQAGAG